jgi:hypothetical protein
MWAAGVFHIPKNKAFFRNSAISQNMGLIPHFRTNPHGSRRFLLRKRVSIRTNQKFPHGMPEFHPAHSSRAYPTHLSQETLRPTVPFAQFSKNNSASLLLGIRSPSGDHTQNPVWTIGENKVKVKKRISIF